MSKKIRVDGNRVDAGKVSRGNNRFVSSASGARIQISMYLNAALFAFF